MLFLFIFDILFRGEGNMKKIKKKTLKNDLKPGVIKYVNEDTNEIKKFVLILLGVALIAVILFFVTAKYIVKDRFQDNKSTVTSDTIDYSSIDAGTLFNRPYNEYYVIAYDTEAPEAAYINIVKSSVASKGKVYYMDLSIESNKKYVGETGNKNATNASELKLVNPTLIHIKSGKIANYYEGKDAINGFIK